MRLTTPLVAIWIAVLAPGIVALAQDADDDAPVSSLAAKQQMIRDRLARLEDRMFRLRESLSESEPENARKLGEALRRASELDLQTRIETIVSALNAANRLDDASQQQQDLIGAYEALLDTLLDRDPDDARRREEMQRLEGIKQDLEALRQRQADARKAAADAIRKQRLARGIEQAIEQMRTIAEEQSQLADPDSSWQSKAKQRSADQKRLANRTKQLAEQIEAMKEADAPEARESLDKAADDTSSSANEMEQAAEKLEASEQEATEIQKRAVEKLRSAIERLEQAREKLEEGMQQTPSQQQRAIAEDAQDLSERMKGDQSEQRESQSPGEQTPGTENVERAEQHMRKAADELDEQNAEKAAQDQDKALDELERAQQQIEEALKQKRQEEREEILRGIESRLKQMVAEQVSVNQSSEALRSKGEVHFTRADTLECVQLADRQTQLAQEGDTCVRLLEEDGTTVVFPQVMGQVTADMRTIAARLSDSRVDALTTGLQADVHLALADLLQSLEKLREQQEQQQQAAGGNGGGSSGADAPLVPTSAELKLLRSAQRRVNTMTTAAGEASSDDAERAKVLDRASSRQAELVEMAREMQKRSEKEHGR